MAGDDFSSEEEESDVTRLINNHINGNISDVKAQIKAAPTNLAAACLVTMALRDMRACGQKKEAESLTARILAWGDA